MASHHMGGERLLTAKREKKKKKSVRETGVIGKQRIYVGSTLRPFLFFFKSQFLINLNSFTLITKTVYLIFINFK